MLTIHLIDSEENPVTVCTGEIYIPPKINSNQSAQLCPLCQYETLTYGGTS